MPHLLFFTSIIKNTLNLCSSIEVKSLFFAICLPIILINFGLRKSKIKIEFKPIDFLYVAFVLCSIISLLLKTHNLANFHAVYVITAMLFVYFYFRFVSLVNKNEKILKFLILIVGIIASIGFYQLLLNKRVLGPFYDENYFGCYLAINVPIILAVFLNSLNKKNSIIKNFNLGILILVISVMIITKCRTAIIGSSISIIIVALNFFLKYIRKKFLIFSLIPAIFLGCYLYLLKPASTLGRLLIWKIDGILFVKNFIIGVGFSNFKNCFNFEQASYFINGNGTTIEKFVAGTLPTAFNLPLEIAAELGIIGLILFCIFWWLILKNIFDIFKKYSNKSRPKIHSTDNRINNPPALMATPPKTGGEFIDYLNLGMIGAVLCFMIMCLFHYPNKIIPIFLIFNFALAWIVNANTQVKEVERLGSYETVKSVKWLKIFWYFALAVSLFFVVIYFQRYMAAREWYKAHDLACFGKYEKAEIIYSNIYSNLKWNGKFLAYYGKVKLQNKKYFEAIELFEKAKFTYPDPYLFENLGVAYINYQSVIEEHPPKSHQHTPVTALKGGLCLSRGECINKAINYWMLASNIQPWRLTPKYYLTDLFYQIGDTNNAVKYAQLVVNTPMKKWTERGKEFKLKSQKMLIEFDKKCDNAGLIVFDINDKKTWNEGKW